VAEQIQAAHQPAIFARPNNITVPVPFLTSEGTGWEDLVVKAFHEPDTIEDWIDPVSPQLTLVFFTHGSMHLEVRQKHGTWTGVNIQQGAISLKTRSDLPREMRWHNLSPEPLQTLHIHLPREKVLQTAEEMAGHPISCLIFNSPPTFHDPLLNQIGFALTQELEQGSPGGKLYAQSAAQMITTHIVRHYSEVQETTYTTSQGLTRRQMNQATDFIMAHLAQDLSLESLAEHVGFSPYHFARLFRLTTGESPHQFVLRQRIEQAQRLLKETNIPLANIAGACGFAHQSHLTQVFKRHLGLTPRSYRQAQ